MDDALLPAGFRFGVATAGFQIEGGYNGPGEPANNWSWWEAAGRVEPSGIALDFWNRYEQHLDRAAAAGCDAFRLSVEWARCEPFEGEVDEGALDTYCRILDACHDRGLQPLVSLHHFCHPAWLGVDFWLRLDAPERFAAWVHLAVDRFAGRCARWVTLNEPGILALQSYITGAFPPGRRLDTGSYVRAVDHLLAAHVLAYDVIKQRQPQAVVSTNGYPFTAYELDRLHTDVLVARSHGVARHQLRGWLAERRQRFHRDVLPRPPLAERALRRVTASLVPLEMTLPRAVAAIYDSRYDRAVDVIQLDWYSALTAAHLRLPGHRTAGGRSWQPARELWDDRPDPTAMIRHLRAAAEPGLDVWVVENGLCNRVRHGRSYPRADGWDRPGYLKAHLGAVVDAIDGGVPVTGYYHWTLADNYEWGSYEPRFGLYGIDRERGGRWSDRDSLGHDAAQAYRRLITGLREGDRSVLR